MLSPHPAPRPAPLVALLLAALLIPPGLSCGLAADAAARGAPGAPGVPQSFADLSADLLPSVVNISSTETVGADQADGDDGEDDQGGPAPPFPPGSPLEKFFHDYLNHHGMGGAAPNAPPRTMQALGSGFIVDASGIVVTNNHVVKGGNAITVTLQDNTVLKATLLGHDDRTDLAVLQVHADHKLPAVSFGDSDTSRVGDWVLAIGNPFGLSGTVTAGIISSRGRDIEEGPYDDFIQTDAPINKGNSGGPLFNMSGQVVGINTAIYSPSGGSIGIGFAIPSNDATLVIAQLRKFGHAKRGWIGVRIQEVTPDIAQSLGLPGARGALIAGLEPNGPAQKAALRTGDVILELDGKEVNEHSLPRRVAETPVGENAKLAIWRDGKRQELSVRIGDFPEDHPKAAAQRPQRPPVPLAPTAVSGLGMKVAAISAALREKYQIPHDQKGVVITDIDPNGKAAGRGLRPGDVVTEVQQSEISTPADLQDRIRQARQAKRPSVLMLVQNGDGMRWVPMPVAAASGD